MNIQEYISSGIIENYVLGLATTGESAEFERMCATHAEVRAAREAFELSLEEELMSKAIQPPADIKQKILSQITLEKDSKKVTGTYKDLKPVEKADLPLRTETPVARMRLMRFLVAASVAALIISTILNIYFFYQYKDYSTRYANLMAENTELAKNNDAIKARLESYENTVNALIDTGMYMVKMSGINVPTSPNPSSLATVYWDTRSKDVYLLVNNMPQPSSDKQYQLWAIVDGKPVDAGVFDATNNSLLVKMKNIPKAQAFAVTLEKRGGSATPNMQAMYVLGKV